MAQPFKPAINRLPRLIVLGFFSAIALVILAFWYFGSPVYTDVGYQPIQPIPYSHKVHVGDLGLDCRYCHTGAEVSPVAMVPPTKTCMNCHTLIKTDSEPVQAIHASFNTGEPLSWVRVHDLPDYAYFDHSAHLMAGVGCATCHGNVADMEVVELVRSLSMGWCLDCHRNPDSYLRPADQVTSMDWEPGDNQAAFAAERKAALDLFPPVSCSGCHR